MERLFQGENDVATDMKMTILGMELFAFGRRRDERLEDGNLE